VRKGKYSKNLSSDKDVLYTVSELGLPVEGSAHVAGVTLLSASIVETLLQVHQHPCVTLDAHHVSAGS
jgi:hypothetical protein